jgi:hypothetical protein
VGIVIHDETARRVSVVGGALKRIKDRLRPAKIVMPITLLPDDNLLIMYRIRKDNNGVTLVCLACTHTDRVQDFDRSIGNQQTLAAHAMLKHVHAEHSRETHVRAMAMVMEWQNVPR